MTTPLQARAQQALGGLLSLLSKALFQDGAFPLSVSASPIFTNTEERMSALALGFALRALSRIPEADHVRGMLARRLQAEMSAEGTWNYWLRNSSDAKKMPYPDDLDSTSIAFLALSLADEQFVTGDRVAKYVKLLLTAEVAPAGPYVTWLVSPAPRKVWQDVDPVVNANIAAVLSSQDRALSGLDDYLLMVLKDSSVVSPYYPSRAAFLSALALADRETFAWFIRAEAQLLLLKAANPLDRALLALALVNAHADASILQGVLEACLNDAESGACDQPYSVFLDRTMGGQPHYAGSRQITLAVCAGALFALSEAIQVGEQLKPDERMMSLRIQLKRLAEVGGAGVDLEQAMLPYFLAVSLNREHELTDEFFLRVCLAQAFATMDAVVAAKEVFSSLGYAADGEETRAFAQYLQHFLTAKQLTEQAHAWEHDFKEGKETPANAELVARLKNKGFDLSTADWKTRLHVEIQKVYWFEVLERMCSEVFSQVEMAGEVCEELPEISRPFWRALISKFGRSARLALEERERAVAFIKSMKL